MRKLTIYKEGIMVDYVARLDAEAEADQRWPEVILDESQRRFFRELVVHEVMKVLFEGRTGDEPFHHEMSNGITSLLADIRLGINRGRHLCIELIDESVLRSNLDIMSEMKTLVAKFIVKAESPRENLAREVESMLWAAFKDVQNRAMHLFGRTYNAPA